MKSEIKIQSGPNASATRPLHQFWATASTEEFTATRYGATRLRAEEDAVLALKEVQGAFADEDALAMASTIPAPAPDYSI